ncbi:Gar1/Naf1 family protein [uncultured Methanobrevibacter sp.]|uniref:Gar1/Naf1 family protein n=1 Tax=uncultured Methanobrevibacter sp. TaxID=253161 RepID=UPI0025FB40E0|nr:Gar1/Naf1 family protein [uncultured Methanobrevibacter sp.]MEE1134545.1 Gar1/Naf1 family protein [Methanobrevibacter sp.]MEE3489530.1 Gar1/Naf1 family protein [Methanobrevibacter sp.]
MKFLGNSLHVANSGKLIARSEKTPSPGGIVFDSKKKKIGKVSYVFGPTKKPYVSIRLFKSADRKSIEKNCGEKLFVSKPKSKKPRKRRMKARHKK